MYLNRTPLKELTLNESLLYVAHRLGIKTTTKTQKKNAVAALKAVLTVYSLGIYHDSREEHLVMSLSHTGVSGRRHQFSIINTLRSCPELGYIDGVQGPNGTGIAGSINPNQEATELLNQLIQGTLGLPEEHLLNALVEYTSVESLGKTRVNRCRTVLTRLVNAIRETGSNTVQLDAIKTPQDRRDRRLLNVLIDSLTLIHYITIEGDLIIVDKEVTDVILGKMTPQDYNSVTTYNNSITLPDWIKVSEENITRALNQLTLMAEQASTEGKRQHYLSRKWALERTLEVHDGHIPNMYMEKGSNERLYGTGLNLQSMPKPVRNIILEGLYLIDIEACHQTILWQIVEQGLVDGVNPHLMVQTKYYAENKSLVRREVATILEYDHEVPQEITPELVKILITACCLYGARTNQKGYWDGGTWKEQTLTQTVMDQTGWDSYRSKEVAEGFLNIPIIKEMRAEVDHVMRSYKKGKKGCSKRLLSQLLNSYERAILNIMGEHGEMVLALHDGAVYKNQVNINEMVAMVKEELGLVIELEQNLITPHDSRESSMFEDKQLSHEEEGQGTQEQEQVQGTQEQVQVQGTQEEEGQGTLAYYKKLGSNVPGRILTHEEKQLLILKTLEEWNL